MSRRGTLLVLASALLLGAAPVRAAGDDPFRLTVAFTGDVAGYLEPCG